MTPGRPRPGEAGSIAVVQATLLLVIVVLGGIIAVDIGTLMRAARVASTAADNAALAAASATQDHAGFLPHTAADRIAGAHGATLTSCDCDRLPVRVTLSLPVTTRLLSRLGIHEVRAVATAELVPYEPPRR